MTTKIKRDVNGIVDFCLDQVEALQDRDDLDIDKKVKYGLAFLKEVRGFVGVGLQHKKLMMQAPEIAKSTAIVLPVGSTLPTAVKPEEAKKAAGE